MAQPISFAAAIIVAGGLGKRMGRPKQLLPLAGKPVLLRAVEAFTQIDFVKQIIVVTSPENREIIKQSFPQVTFALPGATRLASVINGVNALDARVQAVAVHDGARPLVSPQAASRCLQSGFKSGAAVLAVPVKDTIKQVRGGVVERTLERSALWQAQTPQCYQAEVLRRALDKFGYLQDATDESQLVERLGVQVKIEPSDYQNLKITTPEDLLMAEAFLQNGAQVRTGFGYDLHRLQAGRKFIIGGVEIAPTLYNASSNIYYVQVENLSALQLKTMYEMTITDGESEYTVSYGVFSYMYGVLNNPQASEKLVNVAKATWLYADEAEKAVQILSGLSSSDDGEVEGDGEA